MRCVVLGAGAIGAYVGARLAQGGSDVTLIARGKHLEAIQRDGLRLISDRDSEVVQIAATDELESVRGTDIVFVALKAYSLTAIAPVIGPLLDPDTITVWAQNGIPWWYFHRHGGPLDGATIESVDPGGVIAGSIRLDSAVGSVVYVSAELERPGVVRFVEGHRVTIGEVDGTRTTRVAAISDALQAGGLRAPVSAKLRTEVWLKLLGNATFNPITTLTRATLGQLGEVREMRRLLLHAFEEMERVARGLGIELPISLERRLDAGVAVGNHKTSMLQDLEAGKPLEYACMTGAVVEIARRLQIDVPRIETIDACVALLDRAQRHGHAGRELAGRNSISVRGL
jgi:2-dehydropantoate 2-reductase